MARKVDMEVFERLRAMAFRCYYVGALLGGMLETIFFSTEYLYIKDTIKSTKPTMYFGIGTASQHLSGMITAFIGSMYYDRTRHIRCLLIFTCVCMILASVLYILPYSVWLVITGNLLYGFICINNSSVMAELVHVYPQEAVTSKVAILGSLFAIGLVTGPALVYLFVLVDVKVGTWSLGFGNMPALIVGGIYTAYTFFVLKFVHDLTLIYDPKEDAEDHQLLFDDFDENDSEKNNEFSVTEEMKLLHSGEELGFNIWMCSYFRLSYNVMVERHFSILLFTTAVATFSHFLFLGITVVKASDMLHWDAQKIANLRIIMACGVIVASLVIQACTRCMHDYYLLLGSVLFTAFALCTLGLLPYVAHNHTYVAIILYFSSAIYGFIDGPIQIIARAMVAKLVPSKIQGIAEATRFSVFQGAQIFSGLALSFTSAHLTAFMFSIAACNLINVLVLLAEHKFYTGKKQRLFSDKDSSGSEVDVQDPMF